MSNLKFLIFVIFLSISSIACKTLTQSKVGSFLGNKSVSTKTSESSKSLGFSLTKKQIETYEELKVKQSYRYFTMKLSHDSQSLEIETVKSHQDGNYNYQEMLNSLPKNDPRFVVFNFPKDQNLNKVIMLVWLPANTPLIRKTIFQTLPSFVKFQFDRIYETFYASDIGDLEFNKIRSILNGIY